MWQFYARLAYGTFLFIAIRTSGVDLISTSKDEVSEPISPTKIAVVKGFELSLSDLKALSLTLNSNL